MPNTELENNKKEERPFFLRIFASENIELVKLPETIEQTFVNKWTETTAGGSRMIENDDKKLQENQFWCRNPQYFLNITKPTHIKIIIRKKVTRRAKFDFGITITKANPPTTPQEAKIIQGKG